MADKEAPDQTPQEVAQGRIQRRFGCSVEPGPFISKFHSMENIE